MVQPVAAMAADVVQLESEAPRTVDAGAIVPRSRRSLLQTLCDVPSHFSFDAAVAVMMRASRRADPGQAIRFEATLGLGFVSDDISTVRRMGEGFTARTGSMGLTGPGGVLPRPYTEMANGEARHRSEALSRFLDVLAQRPLSQFAEAGIKYRPHRAADAAAIAEGGDGRAPADGLRETLLAFLGYAEPGLLARLRPGPDPLLYYAGLFAARPRSADRLAAFLSDWLGRPVEVIQFAGAWLELGPDQMSCLPQGGLGLFSQLGVDAAAGSRSWDIQSRIELRVGPLSYTEFRALLPGGTLLPRLGALVKAYLGQDIAFAINPVLAAAEVPAPALDPSSPSMLGLTGWLPVSGGRKTDAAEARFAGAKL